MRSIVRRGAWIKNAKLMLVVVTMTLILPLSLFSAGQAETGSGETFEFSLGHVGSIDDVRHTAAQMFADALKEKTGGRATVTIYPASQLGSYEEMEEGLQMGTIDIVLESIGTLSRYSPVAGIESMPFLFLDKDHYLRVWEGDIGQEIIKKIADEANFLVIGHLFRGARELTSNVEVHSAADLKGLKIRVSPMKERLITWQVLGASPTPMAFGEVFTALDQGIIDAQENPVDTILANSLHEVQDYLILTSHMSNGYTFIFNNKTFNDLPADIQKALRESIKVAEEWFNNYIATETANIIKQLEEGGMTVIRPDIESFEGVGS